MQKEMPRRLMAGQRPLKPSILVRVQAGHPYFPFKKTSLYKRLIRHFHLMMLANVYL